MDPFNTFKRKNIYSTLPETNSWKWMIGRLVSFWEDLFSRAMLVSGRVCDMWMGEIMATFSLLPNLIMWGYEVLCLALILVRFRFFMNLKLIWPSPKEDLLLHSHTVNMDNSDWTSQDGSTLALLIYTGHLYTSHITWFGLQILDSETPKRWQSLNQQRLGIIYK